MNRRNFLKMLGIGFAIPFLPKVESIEAPLLEKGFNTERGSSAYNSGLFYCPYVPLQMVRAIDPYSFQPKIGFKTRYGMVANPFAEGLTQGSGALNSKSNVYYRGFKVTNLV